jgi:hypothetical protein
MIFMIISAIAVVGGTSMYVWSLSKNVSMRLKSSMMVSWLAITSLAAYQAWVSQYRHCHATEDTDRKESSDRRKYDV